MTSSSCFRWAGAAAATSALALLAACGGGGSSSSLPAAEKGTVSVLLTDAPTDDFCHAIATVESVDLLGDGGRENIWTGSETIDVLAMRNYSDVFVVNTDVTVASYDKIRLTLADLTIEKCDDTGTVIETHAVKLPGNGKLDLNPRGSFQVVGNEALLIEIDLAMKYAVHVVEAGNSMHYEFRPVVFVTVTPDDTRLVRVFGEVRDLDEPGFELCPIAPVSSTDDDPAGMEDGVGESDDDDSGRCIDVLTDGGTGIFDANGDPVGLAALANGDLATAIGFLRSHDDDDDDDSRADDLLLDAVTVEIGPADAFARVRGAAESAVGNNDRFAFLPEGGTSIDVLLQAGTRIFQVGTNEELTSAAIQPGVAGEIDGVESAADPATLKSSLIVLEEGAGIPEVALLDATVASIDADDDADPATRQLYVDNADVTNQCVTTDAATRIIEVVDGPDSIESMEIGVDDLSAGQALDVYGHDDGAGCVLATTIQAYAP
jgi:Domain of unknown function (DUF4382)